MIIGKIPRSCRNWYHHFSTLRFIPISANLKLLEKMFSKIFCLTGWKQQENISLLTYYSFHCTNFFHFQKGPTFPESYQLSKYCTSKVSINFLCNTWREIIVGNITPTGIYRWKHWHKPGGLMWTLEPLTITKVTQCGPFDTRRTNSFKFGHVVIICTCERGKH